MMVSCRGCLHEHLESEECMHCSRAYTDEYEERTLISHAERIRNMTDRKMAEFLVKVMEGTISVTGECLGDRCEADRCVDCVSDWLRTES